MLDIPILIFLFTGIVSYAFGRRFFEEAERLNIKSIKHLDEAIDLHKQIRGE